MQCIYTSAHVFFIVLLGTDEAERGIEVRNVVTLVDRCRRTGWELRAYRWTIRRSGPYWCPPCSRVSHPWQWRVNIYIYIYLYLFLYFIFLHFPRINTFKFSILRINTDVYTRTYIHTNIPTYMHTYAPTYIHTYIHAHINIYIHTPDLLVYKKEIYIYKKTHGYR